MVEEMVRGRVKMTNRRKWKKAFTEDFDRVNAVKVCFWGLTNAVGSRASARNDGVDLC